MFGEDETKRYDAWFNEQERQRKITEKNNAAFRELPLPLAEPKSFELTPLDDRFLSSIGANAGEESSGIIYHHLPDNILEYVRRFDTTKTRATLLTAIVEVLEQDINAQPSALYAHALMQETYLDASLTNVSLDAMNIIAETLEDLLKKEINEPVAANQFTQVYLRIFPNDQKLLDAALRATREHMDESR